MNVRTVREKLAAAWVAALTQKLGDVKVSSHTLDPVTPVGGASGHLWWKQYYSQPGKAVLWIGADDATWERLAHSNGAAEIEGASTKDGYFNFLTGVAEETCQRLRNEGLTVFPFKSEESPAPCVSNSIVALRIQSPSLNGELLLGAGSEWEFDNGAESHSEPAAPSKTIDLLLDVEFPVSISFGQTSMTIRDALQLKPDSIVDLDRAAHDLVDIIVNGCVIARGEVVSVDQQYGIRVRQILNAEQRLGLARLAER